MLDLVRDALVVFVVVGIITGLLALVVAGIIANRRLRKP